MAMISRQLFSFLKNVIFFLFNRIYKEWKYMLGNGWSYDEIASKRGDFFVKQLIENLVQDRASKYDPYMLEENATLSCRKTKLVLGKSYVTGLNSLYQTKISSLTEKGNRLFINANLGAGPLAYERQIIFRFGEFERKAVVQVSLINIKVSVYFSMEKNGSNGFLLNFAIKEMNGFKLGVNGYGYFDWTINLFLSFWTLILGRIVRNLLENELEQFILNRLPNYQFPVEGTSYRSETKLHYQKGVENNEASPSESSCMKQSCEKPVWLRMSPNDKSSVYGHNSEESETSKNFEGDVNTSRCFLETNKFATEMNNFSFPAQSLDLCSGSLNKNSFKQVSKVKAEELISDNSRETLELSRSFKKAKYLKSIRHIRHQFQQLSLNNISNDCSLAHPNVPGKFADIEVEYKGGESADSIASSPAKDFKNELSFLTCEGRGKGEKSKMEDSPPMLQVSNTDQIERNFEVVNENPEQTKLLEISSEIHECIRKNVDGNAFDMGAKLPARVTSCEFSSTKLESSQIDEDVLESRGTKTETFDATSDIDSEGFKTQIEFLEKILNNNDSNLDQHVSVESCNDCSKGNFSDQNLDSKSCNSDMFQNESRISFPFDDFEKLKGSVSAYSRGNECHSEDSESAKKYNTGESSRNQGVETPEIQCISDPEKKVDGNILSSTISHDSMPQIKVEQDFDLVDNEMISTSLQFNEKHENEKMPLEHAKVHAGIPLKHVNVLGGNEYSQFKAYERFNTDNLSDGKELIVVFDFPQQSLDLCNELLQKNLSKVEIEGKCDSFSVVSRDILETSGLSKIIKGMLDSMNYVPNSQPYSSPWEEPPCLNENAECTESTTEILPIARRKLNGNSNKNNLEETLHPKPLHDLLQEKIIAKTRKLLSVLLEFDPEDEEYLSSAPMQSCNLECQKSESISHVVNQILQDSETDGEINSLPKGNVPSLSETEHSSRV